MANATDTAGVAGGGGELRRAIDWTGAFWVASGVPALVLFSIGGIGGLAGTAAFLVWIISMVMGFIQSFTYAEISGLFPNKSGGASVYGATAWLRYGKLLAPVSVWCNWLAWTPVLSLGCAIAAAYIINAVAPLPVFGADSPEVKAWLADAANATAITGKTVEESTQLAIDALVAGATPALRSWELAGGSVFGLATWSINSYFVIGAVLMLIVFAIQHRGILGTASVQKWIGLLVIIPMLIVGIVPLLNGSVNYDNFVNPVPATGNWEIGGWTYFFAALFIAAWSTYAFETAICYTSEFRDPKRDTFKAIFYAGLLCLLIYSLVPFTFQGFLGAAGMVEPGIVNGDGVANAMARMVAGGEGLIERIFVMIMILALMLAIMTAMAGSSRTLYQGSVDGWLPSYLTHVNSHGAPTRAMWTDLVFNLFVLSVAVADATGFFTILAISNCGYIVFNFLNLNAGWIHRVDSGHIERPYRAPTIILALGTILAFVNAFLMGAGAKAWNPNINVLLWALIIIAAIIPIFIYRHYIRDGGRFPDHMLTDLGLEGQNLGERKAGIMPYVVILAGIAVVLIADRLFPLPG
ncbi:MAG: APC family permease [Hyphomicrobiaceae bacterium]